MAASGQEHDKRYAVSSRGTTNPRIALVEDDPECAEVILDEVQVLGFEVVSFTTAGGAIEAARQGRLPSIVLMDLGLPGEDPMAAIAALTQRPVPHTVIVLTGHAGDEFLFQALRSGAVGYVLKTDALGRLSEVLREVQGGGAPMSPSIARRVVRTFRTEPLTPSAQLTAREKEVLAALGAGHTYESAASTLGISVDTIRQHVRNLYRKLHASSKAEAVAIAMRAGWLD